MLLIVGSTLSGAQQTPGPKSCLPAHWSPIDLPAPGYCYQQCSLPPKNCTTSDSPGLYFAGECVDDVEPHTCNPTGGGQTTLDHGPKYKCIERQCHPAGGGPGEECVAQIKDGEESSVTTTQCSGT